MTKRKEINAALRYIQQSAKYKPKIALILGSGLGDFSSRISPSAILRSEEIPHYPISSVPGHAGNLIFGHLQKKSHRSPLLLVFQGRVHFYETGTIEQVIFPIHIAHSLGVKTLIVTNAAGGINSNFAAGDLMVIRDILNLTSLPLPTRRQGAHCTPDYCDENLLSKAFHSALQLNIPLQQGTYCWLKGPSYETPAEIQMLKRLGADAVGMSTVPEIYAAHNYGIKTLGISLISNLAAGISLNKLSHAEVTETANNVKERFSEFMENLIFNIA